MFKSLLKLFGCGGDEAEERKEQVRAKKTAPSSGKVVSPEDLADFVAYVAKALVDDPDSVSTALEDGENSVRIIRIRCRKEDTGKIIGKKGKTISAMRALVSGAAGRLQERVNVEVED